MKNINTLKSITNQGTGKFVLLSMFTAGIYPIMWAWKNTDAFNSELKIKPFESSVFIYLAIAMGVSLYLDVFSFMSDAYNYGYIAESNNVFDILSTIITIAMAVFWIVWAFKMKSALEYYAAKEFGISLRLNGFWTFLFQYFYINYCMNALEEDFAKEKMLADVRSNYSNNSTDDDENKN